MNNYDLIIFDFDGTLLDTAPDVHSCVNETLHAMNLPQITLEHSRKAIGPGPDNFAKVVLGNDGHHRLDEFIVIFRPIYYDRCMDKTCPFPGINETLQILSSVNLAVATNKPLKFTQKILDGFNLSHFFKYIAGPEMVERLKPYPDMILHVLEELKISPDRSLVVGDTDNDILAAHAAGVRSCAVGWGYAGAQSLKALNPNYFVDQPSEISEIVQNNKR